MSGGPASDETVKINDLTLCHKHSAIGHVRATLPDVCKSPAAPVPYPNIAYARDLEHGTTTVLSHGGAMNGVKGSRFFPSYDDEPGTGGGVKSGVNMHEATWLSWSPNVFMEGRAVTRLTDKMLMNRGNTVSIGGYYTGRPQGNKAVLDKFCNYACNCKQAGTARQSCVERAIMNDPTNARDANNGLWPELTYGPDGSFARTAAGMPSRGRGISGARLDVTDLQNGRPTAIYEMKFEGDRYRNDQRTRYDKVARQNGLDGLKELDVEKDCKCTDDDDNKQPAIVPSKENQESTEGNFVQRHPYITAGAVATAGVGTWYFGGAGGLLLLGALGGTTLATQ